jgi:hypothetical protein
MLPDDSFVPKTMMRNGSPTGRNTWGLPLTSVSKDTVKGKTAIQVACDLIAQNIELLDEAMYKYARDQILGTCNEGRRVTAHCGVQAIQTLKEVHDLLIALDPLAG